jgi:hypothetical protein
LGTWFKLIVNNGKHVLSLTASGGGSMTWPGEERHVG